MHDKNIQQCNEILVCTPLVSVAMRLSQPHFSLKADGKNHSFSVRENVRDLISRLSPVEDGDGSPGGFASSLKKD